MTDLTQQDLTDDAFLGATLAILQPRGGYRAGIDAVLLAATAECRDRPRTALLDVGAGVGVVGLCAAARLASLDVTLLEKQPALLTLARRNVARNHLTDRVGVVPGDVLAPAPAPQLPAESFDVVLSNPPFYDDGAMRPSANPLKAAAHAMPAGGLDRWLTFMARMTRPGGTATVIHRPAALDELLAAFAGHFGELTILPLHPRTGQPANRVIVRGRKASRKPSQLLPGLILHDDANGFRPEIDKLLRSPAGFAIG